MKATVLQLTLRDLGTAHATEIPSSHAQLGPTTDVTGKHARKCCYVKPQIFNNTLLKFIRIKATF